MFNKNKNDMKRISTLLVVLMLMAFGTTTWAQTLYVGGVKVDLSATTTQTITGSNISGKVTYSPSSKTLYLESATIRGSISGTGLGSSASTRHFIHLKGTNTIITSDRGMRFDDSYVVLYGADEASLSINSINSSSGYSCISTEGGHFEVWSVRLYMVGASKGFYGTPGSATLGFVNSMVEIDCDAGAVYGYKSVSFDDCKCTDEGVAYQSGKGYVDSAGDRVSQFHVWPLLCVGNEPVRTASSSRTGSVYPWKWTKETKTLEITGDFSTGAYTGIANYGIEGLTIKVDGNRCVQSTNIGLGIEAGTDITGGGTLSVIATAGSGIMAYADVYVCLEGLNVSGKRYGFTSGIGEYTLTLSKNSSNSVYTFAGKDNGDIYASKLVMYGMDIHNDNTYWNPQKGYVYKENTIKKSNLSDPDNFTIIEDSRLIEYYGFSVGDLQVRKNCKDYIMPPCLTSGSIKYSPASNKLTLTNVNLTDTGDAFGIRITNNNGLNIQLEGDNTFNLNQYLLYSDRSFSLTGTGSLTGTSAYCAGIMLHDNYITCTVDGPRLDITGFPAAVLDWKETATLEVRGSTTSVTLNSTDTYSRAIRDLGNLELGSGIGILEPSGGYFDETLKSVTVDGTSEYKGKVVIGQIVDYGMFIAETRVTSANAADILGDGQFSYDASTKTLTVTDANLTNTDGSLGSCISNREIDGLNIKLVGNNNITVRNSPVYSEKSFTITGDGTLTGNSRDDSALFFAGDGMTCVIDGPQLEFTGNGSGFSYGLRDYKGTATLYVTGSTTRLTFQSSDPDNAAVSNLGGLWLDSGIDILEPSGGYFDATLKSVTTDGTSAHQGRVVIGSVIRGDVNADGTVDIADAVAVLSAMAGKAVSGNPDVNGDGEIDIADVVKVLSIMAGR